MNNETIEYWRKRIREIKLMIDLYDGRVGKYRRDLHQAMAALEKCL